MSTPLTPARRRLRAATFTLLIAACGAGAASASQKARTFASPETAVDAAIAALRQDDLAALASVFGEGSDDLLSSGDPVQDASRRQQFLALYDQRHEMQHLGDDRLTLVIGPGAWPFPIPLVKAGNEWSFDLASGIEEVLDRRVGENELRAIQTCLAIVDAQREYYGTDHDGDGILEYAQKFQSTVGRRDGLFWPARPGEPESPLGELVAAAAAEGYTASTGAFHGYHYHMLTSQGPDARGGAYDYLVRDNLIGGFGVLAFPVEYGQSGVMSFMVNHDGVVYQRDLGPDTAVAAAKIACFDPTGWQVVPDKDLAPIAAD
jgi:hypothetical protein